MKNSHGQLVRNGDQSLVLDYQVPNEAIRKYHKDMIEKAQNSLQQQSIHEREISSTTLSIRKEDIVKIKSLMAKFHTEVRSYAMDKDAEETYQFNIQFFNLIKSGEHNETND